MSRIKKILLFGSSGMLGRYVHTYFKYYTNIVIIPVDFRITNSKLEMLDFVLEEHGIDNTTCVINCIGLIPQRYTNKSYHDYYLINSIFPNVLWTLCKKYEAEMIQPTTDCVYNGFRETGDYVEYEPPDETNHYGMSKSLGEPFDCTIIRTSIIGEELLNKKSLLEWVKTSNENSDIIFGWTTHKWNGITCLQYCKIVEQIIFKDLFWQGIRHFYSPTPVSKYELICMIKDTYNLKDLQIEIRTTDKIVNKTLKSTFSFITLFKIPELSEQINELKRFELK